MGLHIGELRSRTISLRPLDRHFSRRHRHGRSRHSSGAPGYPSAYLLVSTEPLGLQHGAGDDVLGRDQLYPVPLARKLRPNRLEYVRIAVTDPLPEKPRHLGGGRIGASYGHPVKSFLGCSAMNRVNTDPKWRHAIPYIGWPCQPNTRGRGEANIWPIGRYLKIRRSRPAGVGKGTNTNRRDTKNRQLYETSVDGVPPNACQ